jgi:GMP synthase-like glutamine amidotransferase
MNVEQILVIDPAMRIAETECYNRIALVSPIKTTYHLPAMYGLQSLQAIDMASVRGMIVLGSASSVHDRLPWQQAFEDWLKPHLENQIPTLGICYGHQMFGYMFGGDVGYVFPDQKKYSCVRSVQVKSLPWFSASKGPLVASHNEMITKLPSEFEVIAQSAECRIDGMAHTKLPIWSFQTHPEATKEFLINHCIEIETDEKTLEKQLFFGQELVESFLKYTVS